MLCTSSLGGVKWANLESSSIFLLISSTQGHKAQQWSLRCLPSNGQTRKQSSLVSAYGLGITGDSGAKYTQNQRERQAFAHRFKSVTQGLMFPSKNGVMPPQKTAAKQKRIASFAWRECFKTLPIWKQIPVCRWLEVHNLRLFQSSSIYLLSKWIIQFLLLFSTGTHSPSTCRIWDLWLAGSVNTHLCLFLSGRPQWHLQ